MRNRWACSTERKKLCSSASKTVESIEWDINYAKYCKKVDEMENFPVELYFLA